jgi:hypothetical protein
MQAPNEASHAFKERWEQWSRNAAPLQSHSSDADAAPPSSGCRLAVVPTTAPSFMRAFDDDDELVYDPLYTAAIILSELRRDGAWCNSGCCTGAPYV